MLQGQLPEDRAARWKLLDQLAQRWFPPAATHHQTTLRELDDAERRLKLTLPESLREWFLHSGGRRDIWCLQDHLASPQTLTRVDEFLILCVESQNVVRWGIREADLLLADPPVLVSDQSRAHTWHVASDSVSAFALQFLALNSKFSDLPPFRANGQAIDLACAAIADRFPRLPFPDLHWPPFPTQLFGHAELIVEVDAATWIWVTALTETAFAEADELARAHGVEWEPV